MKAIIQYQIEVAICMAAFTLFYLIFWRKETNFFLKRIILLGIPFFSIIIPLINLNINFGPKIESNPIQYFTYIPNQLEMVYAPIVTEAEKLTGWEIAFWIMSAGMTIMLLRLAMSYTKILQIYSRSITHASGKFRIIDDSIQSFSFFNMIMINKSQAKSGVLDYILAHENAHKRQGHSWDILWLELVKMLHWFNPVIWLLTQESKKNLEYLADQEVTTTTGNLKNYQYAIVEHATQTGYQLLKTLFSKNNLKKRIIMMNHPNNYKIASWKLFMILPLTAILFMSFSVKIENLDIKKEITEVLPALDKAKEVIYETTKSNSGDIIEITESDNSSQKNLVDNQIYGIVDEYPQPAGMDRDAYIDKMSKMIKYPQAALQNNVSGKIFVQFVVEKNGNLSNVRTLKKIGFGCDEIVEHAFRNGPKWMPGKKNGKEVRVQTIMPVSFVLPETNLNSKNDTTDNEVFTIVENQPYPSTGDWTSYYEKINNDLRYPKEASEKGVDGKVFVQCIVKKDGTISDAKVVKGIGFGCDEEAIRVVKEGPGWIPGRQRGRAVNVRMIVPITFIGSNKIIGTVRSEDKKPVAGVNVIIKGTPTGTVTDNNGEFKLQIKPDQSEIVIASMGYKSVVEKIIAGKNYDIVLERDPNTPLPQQISGTTINTPDNNATKSAVSGSVKDLNGYPIASCNIVIKGSNTGTVTDSNGKFILKLAQPAESEEIVVSAKGYLTQSMFVRNGSFYQIVLMDSEPVSIRGLNIFGTEEKPLFIIDGVEMEDFDERSLNPHDIESIQILKDKKAALEKYGEKASNGVVLINTQSKFDEVRDLQLDKMPEYKEGMEAFYKAFQRNIKYPLDARKENIQGKVLVSFTVTKDGSVKNVKAEKTEYLLLEEIVVVGYSKISADAKADASRKELNLLEEEVTRNINRLDNFKPGIKDGKPVDVRMTLPVTFKLQ